LPVRIANACNSKLKLVRQSVLANEPDLVTDLGIYGNRAVGVQELDDKGRTFRFTLSFDFPEVMAAEQRWDRLSPVKKKGRYPTCR